MCNSRVEIVSAVSDKGAPEQLMGALAAEAFSPYKMEGQSKDKRTADILPDAHKIKMIKCKTKICFNHFY